MSSVSVKSRLVASEGRSPYTGKSLAIRLFILPTFRRLRGANCAPPLRGVFPGSKLRGSGRSVLQDSLRKTLFRWSTAHETRMNNPATKEVIVEGSGTAVMAR